MKKGNKSNNWKTPIYFFYLFLFVLICFYARYFYLATASNIDGIDIKSFAENRNTVSQVLYANRGTIYDSENNILAVNVSSYTVIAYLSETRTGSSTKPRHVVDKQMTAEKLSPLINMEVSAILKLLDREVYQVELGPGGRGITELTKEAIEDLNLPGIDFVESYKRYYPNGDFASYTLGYAKQYEIVDEETQEITYKIIGELGIEKQYDDELSGTDGHYVYQKDRFGYKIPDTPEDKLEAVDGNDIYLTINSNIQRFIESALDTVEKNTTLDWMVMTVADAKTGAILGTSSIPSFDPNIKDIKSYEDLLVTTLYEPGSVMKIYTYMCAIESGKYRGNEYFESGTLSMGKDETGKDIIIRDWNRIGWGTITYDQGFSRSSNVGVSNMMQKMIDKNELRDCLSKYGFGQTTGIELARESSGAIEFNYPIEVASAAFGQGITTTAIQQIQALSIIANDGKMLSPYLIEKIVDPNTNKTVYQSKINESEQLISESTLTKIKDLMYSVVNTNEGTGVYYIIPGYDIIGKTGTAQVYDSKTKTYSTSTYIYSFAGMFPKDDPEIIIYAAIKKPAGTTTTLINATKSVIRDVAKFLNIYGTNETTTSEKLVLKNYTNSSVTAIKSDLETQGLEVIVIGNGTKIINQYPLKGSIVLKGNKVFLVTNKQEITLPNMTNWSRIDVINYMTLAKIKYEIEGYGYVKSQSISKDTVIKEDDTVLIILEDNIKEDSS